MKVKKLPRLRKGERRLSVLISTVDEGHPPEMDILAFTVKISGKRRYGRKYVHGEIVEAVEKRLDRGF